eukprot:2718094-Pleurochrysis_carterae.AAC.2
MLTDDLQKRFELEQAKSKANLLKIVQLSKQNRELDALVLQLQAELKTTSTVPVQTQSAADRGQPNEQVGKHAPREYAQRTADAPTRYRKPPWRTTRPSASEWRKTYERIGSHVQAALQAKLLQGQLEEEPVVQEVASDRGELEQLRTEAEELRAIVATLRQQLAQASCAHRERFSTKRAIRRSCTHTRTLAHASSLCIILLNKHGAHVSQALFLLSSPETVSTSALDSHTGLV